MSTLIGYFDDSRDHGMFVAAGYIASATIWERFSDEWAKILDDAPRPLSEFRASDCRHRRGDFSGWSKHETTELTKDLVSLITDPEMTPMVGVGDGVFTPRADRSLRASLRKMSYRINSTMVIGQALMLATEINECSEVRIVFDEQGKLEHLAREAAGSAETLFGEEFEGVLRRPRFAQSHTTIPLQAADLLAYETLKEVRNRIEDREVSTALERLTRGRRHVGRYLNLDAVMRGNDVGDPLPEYDGGARLGVVYDRAGADAYRGYRLDDPDAEPGDPD